MSVCVTYQALGVIGAKDEIDVPGGLKFGAICRASKCDQTTPANSLDFTRETSYEDADIAAGEVAMADGSTSKTKGKAFKLGTALADGDLVTVEGILSGEVQGYGDGT